MIGVIEVRGSSQSNLSAAGTTPGGRHRSRIFQFRPVLTDGGRQIEYPSRAACAGRVSSASVPDRRHEPSARLLRRRREMPEGPALERSQFRNASDRFVLHCPTRSKWLSTAARKPFGNRSFASRARPRKPPVALAESGTGSCLRKASSGGAARWRRPSEAATPTRPIPTLEQRSANGGCSPLARSPRSRSRPGLRSRLPSHAAAGTLTALPTNFHLSALLGDGLGSRRPSCGEPLQPFGVLDIRRDHATIGHPDRWGEGIPIVDPLERRHRVDRPPKPAATFGPIKPQATWVTIEHRFRLGPASSAKARGADRTPNSRPDRCGVGVEAI